MWNKGILLGNKGVTRLLIRDNKHACPTYQVCIERESIPTVTPRRNAPVKTINILINGLS